MNTRLVGRMTGDVTLRAIYYWTRHTCERSTRHAANAVRTSPSLTQTVSNWTSPRV